MGELGKVLILFGVVLVVMGLLLLFFEKLPFGLGRLPGDILIKRDNFTIYIPITTSIILSLLLTLFLNLLFALLRR
ncbi:MAG: DUF2905 domain-containing protein [Aquificae bacterium]|nr:DUF2905 domain-containing protein [Aquificota bacterium]